MCVSECMSEPVCALCLCLWKQTKRNKCKWKKDKYFVETIILGSICVANVYSLEFYQWGRKRAANRHTYWKEKGNFIIWTVIKKIKYQTEKLWFSFLYYIYGQATVPLVFFPLSPLARSLTLFFSFILSPALLSCLLLLALNTLRVHKLALS